LKARLRHFREQAARRAGAHSLTEIPEQNEQVQRDRKIRDRSFENQRHRASRLNLPVAAITLWNTVYLESAAELLARSSVFDPALLGHVSPLGWEHVNLSRSRYQGLSVNSPACPSGVRQLTENAGGLARPVGKLPIRLFRHFGNVRLTPVCLYQSAAGVKPREIGFHVKVATPRWMEVKAITTANPLAALSFARDDKRSFVDFPHISL
jgi:hypothetical protein